MICKVVLIRDGKRVEREIHLSPVRTKIIRDEVSRLGKTKRT